MIRKERREERKQKIGKVKVWVLGKLWNYSMGNDLGGNMMSVYKYMYVCICVYIYTYSLVIGQSI